MKIGIGIGTSLMGRTRGVLVEPPTFVSPPVILGSNPVYPGTPLDLNSFGSFGGGQMTSLEWELFKDGVGTGLTGTEGGGTIYMFAEEDIGSTFFVRVTIGNAGGENSENSNSLTVLLPPPQNTGLPLIQAGESSSICPIGTQIITDNLGTWDRPPTEILWDYQVNESPITSGVWPNDGMGLIATNDLFEGDLVRLRAVASNAGGEAPEVFSNTITIVGA